VVAAPQPRVLAVVNDFPAPSQTFILRKLRGLASAGFDISVAATRFRPGAADEGFGLVPMAPWRDSASLLASIGPRGLIGTGRAVASALVQTGRSLPSHRRVLLAPLAGARADIVHFEFSGIAVSLADLLPQLRPSRLVVSCRGAAEQIVPLTDPRRAGELSDLFAHVDLIHCVSDDMAATVEALGAPRARIMVNRPAVPVADFATLRSAHRVEAAPLRVLSIGRLHWKKGFDDGLRAIALLAANGVDVDYRIAGEGAEREKLTFLRHQLGLADRVGLLGVQTQAEIATLVEWADVLLLPSLSEGISNAVLEAMAAGLPVVSTACGGMREVIDDGADGFIVDAGDFAAMAARLRELAADPSPRARIGAAAAQRAATSFDLSRQVSRFAEAYAELLRADEASTSPTSATSRPDERPSS
jgi:colanic acid/amylovoran biosynthesis glycosyltransferase